MYNNKQRNTLLKLNRLLIYGFGLLGLFFDYTWAYVISLTLWVWLPSCIRYEWRLFDHWRSHLSSDLIKPHDEHDISFHNRQ